MSTALEAGDPVAAILAAVESVCAGQVRPVALHEPRFGAAATAAVVECVESTFVSSVGRHVDGFERALVEYTGCGHAIAVANGTVALQLCLELAGVARGDEVLVPALSFVATANAVAHAGGVPHFVDCEAAAPGLSTARLERHLAKAARVEAGVCRNRDTGARIAAVVPMHAFGHPVDMDALGTLANHYGIAVVEDAAESLGSLWRARHAGTFGRLASLSFNGNKILTTGGGGAILTADPALARRAKHLTTTAKLAHPWRFTHDAVGYNFRLPNLNAALGLAQMPDLESQVAAKRRLADAYRDAFAACACADFIAEPDGARSNYWLCTIALKPGIAERRDDVLSAAHARGLLLRPAWDLLHELPMYRDHPRADLANAESLGARLINLPSSGFLAPR